MSSDNRMIAENFQVFLVYFRIVIQIVYGLLVLRRLDCLLLLTAQLMIARRIGESGLRARRLVVRPILKQRHRTARLVWITTCRRWRFHTWEHILFRDESRPGESFQPEPFPPLPHDHVDGAVASTFL
jgi:hypothetical protein